MPETVSDYPVPHWGHFVTKLRHRVEESPVEFFVLECRILHERLRYEGHPDFATPELTKKFWQEFMLDNYGIKDVQNWKQSWYVEVLAYWNELYVQLWYNRLQLTPDYFIFRED